MQEIEWKSAGSGIREADLYSIAVCPADSRIAYAGSYNAVYMTSDSGERWNEVLSFRGTDNSLNTIAVDPLNEHIVYAGTARGLYRSSDRGLHWERIFRGMGEKESMVFTVYINPDNSENVYIGTVAGIYFTEDSGRKWESGQNLPSYSIVTSIIGDPYDLRVLYAGSVRGIYKSTDSGAGWARIYKSDFDDSNLHLFIMNEDESPDDSDITGIRYSFKIRKIISVPGDRGTLFAATSDGLLVTRDSGLTWKITGSAGLTSHNVRDIAMNPGDTEYVYAATDRGIFGYSVKADMWEKLYKGLPSSDIRSLYITADTQNGPPVIWALTRMGVYKSSPSPGAAGYQTAGLEHYVPEAGNVLRMFDYEPSIEEIKEAAIEYAEVSPEKIRKWRKAAANRAWLPDLSMKYGRARDWQSSSYFYSTKDEKYKDDDITRGKDSDWYISLSWNLGDLIWDDAQTSIDNRSKLMVQLRDDILNEVMRLYFERRRLQIDMVLSPSNNSKDIIERVLRIQELTAGIDALTGSFLSRRLAQ
ncbi:MAG: hypothetical protein C4581_03215 [Nitrospiraceae bacterium]|nr:MAG: hypothetical protein C4581_03215 [Nitrospiraceae bacterium]